MGNNFSFAAIKLFDHGLFAYFHSLLFELLLCKGADFGILDGQYAVHHFDNSRVRTKCVVKARKFDPDRARSDDQQFLWHARWCQSRFICPNEITIPFKTRQFTRPCTRRKDDVLGRQGLHTFVSLDRHLAFRGD